MSPFTALVLPNGAIIPNRIAKASMEESMADPLQGPSEELVRLYAAWAQGGAGLLLTGNVMVDRRAMTGPSGVVLEDDRHLHKFRKWAHAGSAQGAQVWLQINHPGRQMQANLGQQTWAPSAIALELGRASKRFAVPLAMNEDQITEVLSRFVRTAQLAEQAGFTGVEIHAAHGYLISQFLSPITNKRTDAWGGRLENRARLLLDIVQAVRAAVSPKFCVAVKLNSADFQRGGFSADDAKQVVLWLNGLAVDLVELSGGSYESPAMQGEVRDGRTLAREAYFLEFASDIAKIARMPIMVTGGIRRLAVLEEVLSGGVAIAGIATALAINPALPREWKDGKDSVPELRPVRWKGKALVSVAKMAMAKFQLRKLSRGQPTQPDVSPLRALLVDQLHVFRRTRRYRRFIATHSELR
jgi:2,4-dienoyl-CoA reductase-like NADH-dependent reductase (Old Yellow Enzyme family)